ncbi:hypothetical protein TNCV_2468641 [Trichonephila clavipes]|nr:hypothetical protein TNCV_2468641 [Trichonephila clavipes]
MTNSKNWHWTTEDDVDARRMTPATRGARVGLVGRRLAHDSRPAASKDEPLLRTQAIWNYLPQADIQNLFDSMPRRIVPLIAALDGYTKY